MANEIRVTVKAVDETKKTIDEVRARAAALKDPTLTIHADVEHALDGLDIVELRAREVDGLHPTVHVSAETGEAEAELEVVKEEADAVDRQHPNVSVDANTAMAVSKISALIGLISVLGVAAAGAMAGLGAGAVAGGAGLLAGFSGIGGAVQALGKSASGGGGAASNTANQVRQANQALAQSEHQLGVAQRDARQAQRDLNTARQTAIQDLKDLQRQTEDMALSQRGAALAVEQEKKDLDQTLADPTATNLQRRQAQLAYDESVQHQKDLGDKALELAAKKSAADKAGVDGSKTVQEAQQKVKDTAYQVAQAQQAVANAHIAVGQAAVKAGGGMSALNLALAKLSPTAREFAVFLRGFIDGPLKSLQRAGQDAFLPGVQRGLTAIEPIMKRLEGPFAQFERTFGDAIGGLIVGAAKLAGPLLRMGDIVLKAFDPGKSGIDGFARSFQRFVDQITKDGSLEGAMKGIGDMVIGLGQGLAALIPAGLRLTATLGPALGGALKALGPALVAIANVAGPLLVAALKALTPWLDKLTKWITDNPKLAGVLTIALMAIGPAVAALGAVITGVMGVIDAVGLPIFAVVAAVAALAAGVWYLYEHNKPFQKWINTIGKIISDELVPAFKEAWAWIVKQVQPALAHLTKTFQENRPEIEKVVSVVGKLYQVWVKVQSMMAGTLIKVLAGFIGWVATHFINGISAAVTWVGRLVDLFSWLSRNVGSIMSSVGGAMSALHGVVPGFAHGGIIGGAATGGVRGGWNLVGEHGPELLRVPGGSNVYSNPDTQRMLGGRSGGGGDVRLIIDSAGGRLDDLMVEIIRRVGRVQPGLITRLANGGA